MEGRGARLILPIVSALVVLFMFQGPVIFSATYWKNTLEFSGLFLKGWGALPMYDGLKERQFFAFIMGFIIPVFYVLSMILTATLTLLRQISGRTFLRPSFVYMVWGCSIILSTVPLSAVIMSSAFHWWPWSVIG